MNEFLYVEFIFNGTVEGAVGMDKLSGLGADFNYINDSFSEDTDKASNHIINGKITSQTATVIKLSDKFLADRMHISYISDTLKNKYRNV